MESIPAELAKNEIQSLVDLVKNEAQYLCCFTSYAQEYEQKKDILKAKLQDVSRIIDKARGASHVTSAALQWKREAEELIAFDSKKEKCFNEFCLNCWRQYRKGRDLAKWTLHIDTLLGRCNSDIVDGPTDLPGMKYRCIPNFMYFESRKSTFQDLKKALEDDENNMVGLYGLGGTGKTSMAKEVGAELEGSTFSKVIFLVVSKPPDFKKLRGEIARHLDLKLEDGEEEVHQDRILTKINELKEKLLIVLDDLWMEFDLTNELAIPPRHLHKGCTVLITSRIKDICTKMECQRKIQLDALTDEEALSLFLEHTRTYDSSNLERLAPKIVKHCHGIPVVTVAVAGSLKGRPSIIWKETLRNLQNGKSILNVHDDLKKVYECLKLSYDNLKNEKAKKLLLISSLFPEDFEIPMEFLIRIGVGMGPFGEVDDYNEGRIKVLDAIVELLDSSLLLNGERECVMMHDLVHEVALLIGEKDIQCVIESKLPVKKGLQCLFWKNDDFPKHFDGRNLEILLLVLDGPKDLEVPATFFTEMTKLKVLFLRGRAYYRSSAPLLFPSIQSLQDIRTLNLVNLELRSISMLGKLRNLESLWLDCCSIIKLPGENFELEKLRFLRVENCKIEMSNPFELIEACPQLEELTFYHEEEEEDKSFQKVSFHALQIYQISSQDLSGYFKKYGSLLSRCLQPGKLMRLISEATFKQLARTAELLILVGYEETEQKNLIPDIVPVDDRGMADLIILKLQSWPGMQCLIDAKNNHFDVNAFSNLVELCLCEMGLSYILFNGNYNLCHLKTMTLKYCPKLTSVFLLSTAQSLSQLEELIIEGCDALERIVEGKSPRGEIACDDADNDKKSYGTLFPKFKILEINLCCNLEIIWPILPDGGLLERITIGGCGKLKYIIDKFQEVSVILPPLERMELYELPSLVGIFREYKKSIPWSLQQPAPTSSRHNFMTQRSFCWAQICCFKSRATSEESNGVVSTQGLLASKKWFDTALTLGRQLALHVRHVRKMKLAHLSLNLVPALFTLSMASMISWEELTISNYDGLKHLVTSEEDDHRDEINCYSIFPKLQNLEIWKCRDLEFLFLSSISIEIKNLKSLTIKYAAKLTYVVGKYQHHHCISNQNQNDELHFELPALESLCFKEVSAVISIGPTNFKIASPSLQNVCSDDVQPNLNITKEVDASIGGVPPFLAAQSFLAQSLKNVKKMQLVKCGNLMSLSTLSIAASTISLEYLTVSECHKLKCITTHEGDAQVDNNYYSIFPRLEKMEIEDCEELEFLFLSATSKGLEKLKYLAIEEVPKLKYVVGNYQNEQRSSNQIQIDELHFNLPALETFFIQDAPMMSCICSKNYKLMLSSLKNVKMRNCGIKSFTDYNMVNLTTIEEVDASIDEVSPFYATQSLLVQSLKNVREIKLVECGNIISLSTLFIASSLISLETLTIWRCHKLKCITTHEGDAQVHKNYCSIFPRLENLEIWDCEELESIFVSAVSCGLEKLKSLPIKGVPKLKYVVGNHQKEQHSSNQIQIDELHFDLPALETLDIKDAPMMSSIWAKNYKLMLSSLRNVKMWNCGIKSFTHYNMVNLRTTQELDASTYGVPSFHIAQSLLVQSLKNVREIELVKCGNLISLSTLSIAASAISLENLTIRDCHKLKWITTHEGDAQVDKNYCSIFPRRANMGIEDCKKLEYLFLSAISGGLKNLKSLTVRRVPKLKYVLGKYQQEQRSSNQNQNDELHFDLPALKMFSIEDAPIINGICVKNYKLVLSSLQNVKIRNCNIKSFTDFNLVDLRTTKEVHASTNGAPLFYAAQSLLIQSLKNITKVKLVNCADLISVSTLSIASTIVLEDLTIQACDNLKCIVEDEGDAGTHMNYNSIFPKLKQLHVIDCDVLEYLFPAFAFRSHVYLESLWIYTAPMLKYVFGRSQYEDNLTHENQNIQTHIDFPALKDLSIMDVPELVSIYPKNNYLRGLSLISIALGGFSEFAVSPCNELLVYWHTNHQETKAIVMGLQTLKSLEVKDSRTEVIFDLTYMDIEKNGYSLESLTSYLKVLKLEDLSELVNLCVGPKRIIRFDSLQYLTITACKKLRVIFSASIVRSLPMLKVLNISKCEELVHIVEEDYETIGDEPCFPNIERVFVENCDKLKYLFSITISDMLPKLWYLDIRESYVLEHVLIRRVEIKEMVMKDVLPQLRCLDLKELPNLVSVCHGIDFQILKENSGAEVVDCPNFSFYETSITQPQSGLETANCQVEDEAEDKLSSHLSTNQSFNMGEAIQQSLTKEIQGETEEIVEEDFVSEIAKTSISSSDSKFTGQLDELVSKEEKNESIMMDQSAIGSQNPKKKVPIHTSPSLTVLPTRGNTYANAKIFEEEEEEEEEGNLITSRCPPSGKKAGSFLPKEKLGTSIDDSQLRRAMPITPFVTVPQDKPSKEPIHVSHPIVLPRSPSTTAKCFEEEEKGGLITTHRHGSDMKAVSSLRVAKEHKTSNHGNTFVPPMPIISSGQASETILPLGLIPSKALTSPTQTPMSTLHESTYRRNVQENDGTTSQPRRETLGASQISCKFVECSSSNMTPSIYDANNAFSVAGVKEILDMMKLEGVEPSLLTEAFKTNPKLCLSLQDRSTELLCYSYRVLLNILNILATRSPFTITEADKRLLAKYLKDAFVLGFDKDWLESIKIKVFNCDASELHRKQQVLKSLGNKLEANKRELANVCDQEAKAEQSVEMAQKELEATHKELEAAYKGLEAAQSHFNVAQQEHANIRVRHSQLLEEFQEILEQRDQCSEITAVKLRPFGF